MKKNTTTTTATEPQLRFLFTFKGSGNTYGPMFAPNEEAAKTRIKKNWGIRYRSHIEVWQQTEAEAEFIRTSNEQFYHSLNGQAGHVCQLDFS